MKRYSVRKKTGQPARILDGVTSVNAKIFSILVSLGKDYTGYKTFVRYKGMDDVESGWDECELEGHIELGTHLVRIIGKNRFWVFVGSHKGIAQLHNIKELEVHLAMDGPSMINVSIMLSDVDNVKACKEAWDKVSENLDRTDPLPVVPRSGRYKLALENSETQEA